MIARDDKTTHAIAKSLTNIGTTRSLDPITVRWQSEIKLDRKEVISLLHQFGELLPEPLSRRMDMDVVAYAEKLASRADLAFAFVNDRIAAMVILYANDQATKSAHIPMLAVLPIARRRGIGAALVSRSMAVARKRGMTSLNLWVLKDNIVALNLFKSMEFREIASSENRLRMQIELPMQDDPASQPQTVLEPRPDLAAAFGLKIDLRLKRDDLYPLVGGGVKARKIRYIVGDVVENGHDVIVTNGGPQSNHARAAAIASARIGLKCHLVIVLDPGARYLNTGNILLMRMSGAVIEYCRKSELAVTMDRAVARYADKGFNPLYVWGGGHCLSGTVAFVEAAAETRQQADDWYPDFVVLASGTGSTQAGLAIGYADTETRVIGISVARKAERGSAAIRDCVEEYCKAKFLNDAIDIEFLDRWTDGGYENTSRELIEIVERAARVGTFLDPTYSGKGWRGLVELVGEGAIPAGSKVLFWHTGGIMNLQASTFAMGEFGI